MKKISLYFWHVILFFIIIIPTNVNGQDNSPTTHEIIIKNFSFSPSEIIIDIGDIVVFKWIDGANGHNVEQVFSSNDVSYNSGFRSGGPENGPKEWVLPSNYVQENTTLYYICGPHVSLSMRGKIIIGEGTIGENTGGGNLGYLLAIFGGSTFVTVTIIVILHKKNKTS
ncbi:MAG: hypothetical protein HeimC2_16580 [Candidatus Heimdallarchaeota archaeon LC_2]|nr:MAG: hypothetical protein HeimC2_16580 [Candidatus Heimdallarchaeota archaeon LC_2]